MGSCCATAIATKARFYILISDCCSAPAITSGAQRDLPVPNRFSDKRDRFLRFLSDTYKLRLFSLKILKFRGDFQLNLSR